MRKIIAYFIKYHVAVNVFILALKTPINLSVSQAIVMLESYIRPINRTDFFYRMGQPILL